jgi:hypothetical protein
LEAIAGMEQFKNFTSGIQSIVFSIGLIFAGIWAVYEFKAKLYDSLDLSLTSRQVESTSFGYLVEVKLHIQNDGSNQIIMKLGDEGLAITKIKFDMEDKIVPSGETRFIGSYRFKKDKPMNYLNNLIIDPNSDKQILFLFPIREEGVYLINLHSTRPDGDAWITDDFIVIKKAAN